MLAMGFCNCKLTAAYMNRVILKCRLGAERETRWQEKNEAKTNFSLPASLLRECAYKGGRPIPHQSILGAWSQPVGGCAG